MRAVIMGGTHLCRANDIYRYQPLVEDADSHTDPYWNEWILFDSRQTIPLCVLHVDSLPSYGKLKSGSDNKGFRVQERIWNKILLIRELQRPYS